VAVLVGTVTDDVRLHEVPKLRVTALRFTETARARIVKVRPAAAPWRGWGQRPQPRAGRCVSTSEFVAGQAGSVPSMLGVDSGRAAGVAAVGRRSLL
jgi:hypothetical protein